MEKKHRGSDRPALELHTWGRISISADSRGGQDSNKLPVALPAGRMEHKRPPMTAFRRSIQDIKITLPVLGNRFRRAEDQGKVSNTQEGVSV